MIGEPQSPQDIKSHNQLKNLIKARDLDTLADLAAKLHRADPYAPAEDFRGVLERAADGGDVELLRCLLKTSCGGHRRVCELAARNGHLACLMVAQDHACPWDEKTCRVSAMEGHLKCLQYAHQNGCPWDSGVCTVAARGGRATSTA